MIFYVSGYYINIIYFEIYNVKHILILKLIIGYVMATL